jgi:hypothetical protein
MSHMVGYMTGGSDRSAARHVPDVRARAKASLDPSAGGAPPVRARRCAGSGGTGSGSVSFSGSIAFGSAAGFLCTSDRVGQNNPTVKQGGAGSPAVCQESNGVFFF